MKRLLFALVMTLFMTSTFAQDNLYWTMRVKVKIDKKQDWEKKAPVFMKTHYPQFKFRVWQVMTGENTDSYVIVMGPMNYKSFDTPPTFPKGEAMMKADALALDMITESSEVMHARKIANLSSMKADRKLKYILQSTVDLEPGTWTDVQAGLVKSKEARDKGASKMDIDIFRPANSGLANRYTSVRYFEKMEELDLDENMGEMFDKVFGDNAFIKQGQSYYPMVQSTKQELRVLRTDLSSQ